CPHLLLHFALLLLSLSPHPSSPLFPYTTLFRSRCFLRRSFRGSFLFRNTFFTRLSIRFRKRIANWSRSLSRKCLRATASIPSAQDRKSTRLNSSHLVISYAVFCLKKKKNTNRIL